MEFSQRVMEMPASPIRKLVPYAEQAKKRGIEVFHLNIGQPDIDSPKSALNAIKNNHLHIIEYSLSQGNLPYRTALTQYYTDKLGLNGLTEDNFLVTNGGSEALVIAMGSICDRGDEIITFEPYYANYNGFSKMLGINIVAVSSTIENNFALPKIEEIEKQITSNTKAILINNPGNPTGNIFTLEELTQIKEIALKHNLFVISDEVYREYNYSNEKVHSIFEFSELDELSIVIESESKRFSLCGARIGALVTKNKMLYAEAMKFAQARLSPVLFGQIAAAAAYEEYDTYTQAIKEKFSKRRNTVVHALQGIKGVQCPLPNGAFYCMPQLPIEDSDHFAQWLLESFSDNGQTLMVAPATGFYKNTELGKKQVRIAYVLNEDKLQRAMDLLALALQQYPNSTL